MKSLSPSAKEEYKDLSANGKVVSHITIIAETPQKAEKISKNFHSALNVALASKKISEALSNRFLTIKLEQSESDEAAYTNLGKNAHKIEIKSDFTEKEFIIFIDGAYEANTLLDSLIFEIANYHNNHNQIFDDIFQPMIKDKDLYALLCELAESKSDQIADAILVELVLTNVPGSKPNEVDKRSDEDFVSNWQDINIPIGEEQTHPEYYRQQYVKSKMCTKQPGIREYAAYTKKDIVGLLESFKVIYQELATLNDPHIPSNSIYNSFISEATSFIAGLNSDQDEIEVVGSALSSDHVHGLGS